MLLINLIIMNSIIIYKNVSLSPYLSLCWDSVGNSNTTIEEDSEGSSDDLENPFASFVNPDISIPLLSEDEDWNLRNI